MTSARQIYLGSRRGPAVPYDAEVEYLESTGTQYIDTGVTVSNEVGIEIDCSDIQLNTWIAGGRIGYMNGAIGFYRLSGGALRSCFGNEQYEGAFGTARYTITLRDAAYSADGGIVHRFSEQTFANNARIYIFNLCIDESGNLSNIGMRGRMYGCRVYVGDDVIRDFIPVRAGTEGAMYDRVSGQLFRNSGTGVFGFGTDIAGGGV